MEPLKPKPDRFARLVALVWTALGVLFLAALIRGSIAIGLFAQVTPAAPGLCHAVGIEAPGDLVADTKSRTLFIAARDQRDIGSKADGLYYLAFGDDKPLKLAGTPADFHPVALGLSYGAEGAPVLTVVDRKSSGRVSVESFAVKFTPGGPSLSYLTAVEAGLVGRPGGIAVMGDGRFYLANDPAKNRVIGWLNRYALLPRADVLYFNGMMFRESINGLVDPAAVALSPDGKRLFVASRAERRVIGFAIDPFSGTLSEMGSLALPLRPERMTVDAKGNLWVAGAPKLPELTGFDKAPARPAPSKVLRVVVGAEGKPLRYDTVYANPGQEIGAASAVAVADGHLFIGSGLDNKLLDCALQ